MNYKVFLWSFALIFFATFAYAGLEAGILHYYPLESDGTDSIGNNDLAPINAPTHSGGFIDNHMVSTAAGNKYYNNDSLPNPQNISTINLWVNASDWTAAEKFLFVGNESNDDFFWCVTTATSKIQCNLFDNSGFYHWRLNGTSILTNDQYYMLTIVMDTTGVNLYINGSLENSTTNSTMFSPNFVDIGFPRYKDEFGMDGTIDEVGIWSRALSASDVAELYASGSGNPYPFSGLEDSIDYQTTALEGSDQNFTLYLDETNTSEYDSNATLFYNNTYYPTTETVINGTRKSYLATISVPYVTQDTTFPFRFNYTVNNTEYNTTLSYQQVVNNIDIDNCTNYTMPSMNFSILDESDDTAILGTITYSFIYTSGDVSTNYSGTQTGYNFSFCINPDEANITTDIIIQYEATGYTDREYQQQNFQMDNATDYVNLYLLDTGNTTEVTIHVIDDTDNDLENILIEAYRWDVSTSSYDLVETEVTNSEGNTIFDIQTGSTYYKFRFYQEGILQLETNKFKIFDTTLEYVLSATETTRLEEWLEISTITATITYSNTTKIVNYSWSDGSAIASEYCLNVTDMNRTYYNSCSTVNESSLAYTITEFNISYVAYGLARHRNSGIYYTLVTKAINAYESWRDYMGTNMALMLSFIIFLVIATLAITNKSVALVGSTIGVLILYFLGVLPITRMAVMGIVAIGVILLVIMNKRRE